MPFFGGKTGFLLTKPKTKNKQKQKKKQIKKLKTKNQKQKKKQNKWYKEGLGPTEVALRATSPDP